MRYLPASIKLCMKLRSLPVVVGRQQLIFDFPMIAMTDSVVVDIYGIDEL